MKFGEKLRQLREAADLTQQGLADASGVPLGTIRNYEQGLKLPLLPAAAQLARALGKDCGVFMDCEDVAPLAPKKAKGKK